MLETRVLFYIFFTGEMRKKVSSGSAQDNSKTPKEHFSYQPQQWQQQTTEFYFNNGGFIQRAGQLPPESLSSLCQS